MNCNIFRAYDIRGVFGVDFVPNDFYRIFPRLRGSLSTRNRRSGSRCP